MFGRLVRGDKLRRRRDLPAAIQFLRRKTGDAKPYQKSGF
jgi:hypothetical protein